MKSYKEYSEQALKEIKVADHILTMTYALVNDPRLLKFVIKKIHSATEKGIKALLYYERHLKRIPPFSESFEGMFPYLRKTFKRHNISEGYIKFIEEIRNIIVKEREADVEFIRKDKFVFASKNYDLNIISENEIKEYLVKAKLFINAILGVVYGSERINR